MSSNQSLNKLVFDTTQPADSANVGAYLRASDGTLLTHTGGALDVQIAGGVNVEVDLSHVDDSVRLGDGTAFFTSTSENGDIALDVHLSNTEISVIQGSDTPWEIADGGNSITVDAVDLDIRDLAHTADSVRLGDGTSFFTSTSENSDIALDVHISNSSIGVVAAALETSAHGATSATSTATDIVGTDLVGRAQILLQNLGNKDAYVGNSNGVTTANGILLPAGGTIVLDAGASVNLHAITSSGTADIRYFELAA